jgi:hypothetical protein
MRRGSPGSFRVQARSTVAGKIGHPYDKKAGDLSQTPPGHLSAGHERPGATCETIGVAERFRSEAAGQENRFLAFQNTNR